jgi:multimeric flavodoxin WrbA
MKVLAINGSPKKNGNTARLINTVFAELEKEGIETEMINIGRDKITGCLACGYCKKEQNETCVQKDDPLNEHIQKMKEADGIILGSPVYFADITGQMKCFIDRAGYVCRANGLLKGKVGASVVAVRRAGALTAFNVMNDFLHIQEMIQPGASYWNLAIGRDPGDVENDTEGMETMQSLGRNMASLLKKLN